MQRSEAASRKSSAPMAQAAQVGRTLPEQPMGSEDQELVTDEDQELDLIDALGVTLKTKRQEAIEHREQTGIEQDWLEDEEFYQAIDAANPEGDSNAGVNKPVTPDGGASGQRVRESRSSAFIPLTRAYVDAASARVGDMLLPNDDKPWQLKPTPVDDMGPFPNQTPIAQVAAGLAGNAPMPPDASAPGFAPPDLAPQAQGMNQQQPQAAPARLPMGVATSALSESEKRAELAETRIDDWMVECQWNGEVRKVIEDAAKVGTGVLKGPFPVQRTVQKVVRTPDGRTQLIQETRIVPVSKRVPYKHFYPAPDAGDNHQNGSFVFEYDSIGSRELRKLAKDSTYIRKNVLKVLKEGPAHTWSQDTPNNVESERIRIGGTFPLWYFYGELDREVLIAAGVPEEELGADEDEQVLTAVPALVIMVNDTVIKATLSPMDTGGFPYDVFPWQRRDGMIWGKGVARQMRTPQRMLNASVRSMMDNGGLTSGPIWAMRKAWIEAIDGKNELTPRKGFYMTEQAPPDAKIQDALSFTNIQSNITEMQQLVQMAKAFAEDATGLPMLMQGQQGDATDTAAGMTILNNNGGTVLRRIARTFDDNITEPHVRRYYAWLMENPDNEECKGDFQIDARGSSFLVDRDLQNKALNQLAPLFMQHPDVHPGRFVEELAAANRLNFRRFMLTDEEKKARDSKQPPAPPQVQVAQLREQGATQRQQADLQYKQGKDGKQFQLDEAQLQKDWETHLAELEQKGTLNTDNIKAMLAATVMKLRTQLHDNHADRTVDAAAAMATPAEPPGRAPAGEAFSA